MVKARTAVLRLVAFSAASLLLLAYALLHPSRLDQSAHAHATGPGSLRTPPHPPPRPVPPQGRQLQKYDATPVPPDCRDTDKQCAMWVAYNECVRNARGMVGLCPKSCGACTPEGKSNMMKSAVREEERLRDLDLQNSKWHELGDKNGQRYWPDDVSTPEEMQRQARALEESGTFEWFGLQIKDVPAKMRIRPRTVRTDYNVCAIDPDVFPPGYATDSPAFSYYPRDDRLFVTLSTSPRAMYFPNFLTMAECDSIVSRASKQLRRSQVAISSDMAKRGESAVQEIRSSRSGYVDLKSSDLINVHKRLLNLSGANAYEPIGVLNYQPMQHYAAHTDYFEPTMYGGHQSSNRFLTVFLNLNDCEEGGATTLPRANGGRHPKDFREVSCRSGAQIFPRKGSAVAFYGMRQDRSLDPFSLHGGCDVVKGEKWSGPTWFRIPTPEGTGYQREFN
eukprot:Hpha_TRINITY_DN3092_c0_g1::TRINITY_DN3092_c0_g1_i2::g.138469::m.138469/K00472/P4HA; prolyl 4-hydroxylase